VAPAFGRSITNGTTAFGQVAAARNDPVAAFGQAVPAAGPFGVPPVSGQPEQGFPGFGAPSAASFAVPGVAASSAVSPFGVGFAAGAEPAPLFGGASPVLALGNSTAPFGGGGGFSMGAESAKSKPSGRPGIKKYKRRAG
jgi:hypothetical protein